MYVKYSCKYPSLYSNNINIHFIIVQLLMKLVRKLPTSKNYGTKPMIDFTSIEREQLVQWNQSKSNQRSFQFNCLKTISVSRQMTHSINQIHYTNDNTATRVSTNPIYDSSRQPPTLYKTGNSSILTLKQIRTEPQQINRNPSRTKDKNRRKIFVSISKTNRNSFSGQKRAQTSPRAVEFGSKPIALYPLQKKRRIMNMIQLQLNETAKDRNGFC